MGSEFSHPLTHLPQSLTHLKFKQNNEFNHPLEHLPPSLTHIYFVKCGKIYEQSFACLPTTLVHFWYTTDYRNPAWEFPSHVRVQAKKYKQASYSKLPKYFKFLSPNYCVNFEELRYIPPTIKQC
eukprot:Phypoly_transcript_26345.p1 GENE.Phypoly_transcript_26345~~Phypoly_transcript_26345.p1  ORF type:complete len:139 (+),score=14.66 Phypoly_transcript_26345:44-418(+)